MNTQILGATSFKLSGIALVLAMMGTTPALASHLVTTTDLRNACQTSPAHTVVFDHAVKIIDGARPPATEQVLSGCTIVLGPGAKFEAERISMTFAGPLAVESTDKAEVKFSMSFFAAPSVNFNLTGAGSAMETTLSGIHATAGGLLITMGDEAKLIVLERLLPGPSDALAATTTVQIRGGHKFTVDLNELGVSAPQGIAISMNGNEGLLQIVQALLTASNGTISITAAGTKGLVGMSETNLRFADALLVRLDGADSSLNMKQTSAGGNSSTQDAPGGILVQVGSGAVGNGKIETSEVSFFNVASIRLLGSPNGLQGGLKMEKSRVSASGDIVLETGPQGVTEVKENSGGSSTLFRVAAGAGGSCIAQPNSFFAPVAQLCQ
jgi:hypothetical protein